MSETDPEELRRNWRVNWLGCINQLADFELQRRKWLDKGSDSPHWSFIEFHHEYVYDCILDGSGDEVQAGYGWALGKGFVTTEEVACVAEFDGLLRLYEPPSGDWYNHEAILNDPAWHRVVGAAAFAKTQLATMLDDPAELRCLLRPIGIQ